MSIGNKKEALIRAIKNSKCCCDKDSSNEQGGGTINYDELAEKFRNFYIYPKKDKARFFQDGVDGEYDVNKNFHQNYFDVEDNHEIADESLIIGTANVEDYFEVSDIEVIKLLAIGLSVGAYNSVVRQYTDTSKFFIDQSTVSDDGLESDHHSENEEHSVTLFHYESGDSSAAAFGVVLTPEDYTKFYVLATPTA